MNFDAFSFEIIEFLKKIFYKEVRFINKRDQFREKNV